MIGIKKCKLVFCEVLKLPFNICTFHEKLLKTNDFLRIIIEWQKNCLFSDRKSDQMLSLQY